MQFDLINEVDDRHWFSSVRQGTHSGVFSGGRIYVMGTPLEIEQHALAETFNDGQEFDVWFEQKPNFQARFVAKVRAKRQPYFFYDASDDFEEPMQAEADEGPQQTIFDSGDVLTWAPIQFRKKNGEIPMSALIHIEVREHFELAGSNVRFFERSFSKGVGSLLCRGTKNLPSQIHVQLTGDTRITCPQCVKMLNNLMIRTSSD